MSHSYRLKLSRPSLKLKVSTRIPARLAVESPILLNTTGGVYTFSLDMNAVNSNFDAGHPDLTAIESLTGTGLITRTADGAAAVRTITGTANEIIVTNGNGVSGNPTLSISSGFFANPSASIGLTANNGSASTAMRSDGTPALSQSIAPTWTALHTYASTAGGINVSGNPGYSVSTGVNPYLLTTSLTSQIIQATASSQTAPETAFQSIITSAVGSASASSAFKIAGFFSATGAAGTADIYGGNFVGQLSSGAPSTSTGVALEADFNANNAHYGDAAGSPTAPYATPLYVASGGTNRITSYILVVGGGSAGGGNRGLTFQSGTNIRLNTIEDYSTVAVGGMLKAAGSYANNVLDLQSATGAYTSAIKFANNKKLTWRNAADSADISPIEFNNSNQLVLGAGAVNTAFSSQIVTLASGASAASMNVSPGTAPTSPNNGDVWTTSAGYFSRINGITQNLSSGRLLRTVVFTASGTWTAGTGTNSVVVKARGGGGGGGGVSGAGACAAAGGGQGAYSESYITSPGSSQIVTIGAGGSAGASSGGNGGNGGTTSFGALLTVPGGSGGAGGTTSPNTTGGAGGVAGTADISIPGASGGMGLNISGTASISGPGGGDGGGTGLAGANAAGNAGSLGGGGSGADSATAVANAGGAGGSGWLIVYEYS